MAVDWGGARENSGPRPRSLGGLELERERTRHEKAKADRAEFAHEVERGLHLPREVVAAAAATAISAFAQAMRSLGPTLERTAGLTPEQALLVDEGVDAALAQLSEALRKMTEWPGAA